LRYRTPGAATGAALSLVALALLVVLAVGARARHPRASVGEVAVDAPGE
jgi:hypothetical protein